MGRNTRYVTVPSTVADALAGVAIRRGVTVREVADELLTEDAIRAVDLAAIQRREVRRRVTVEERQAKRQAVADALFRWMASRMWSPATVARLVGRRTQDVKLWVASRMMPQPADLEQLLRHGFRMPGEIAAGPIRCIKSPHKSGRRAA